MLLYYVVKYLLCASSMYKFVVLYFMRKYFVLKILSLLKTHTVFEINCSLKIIGRLQFPLFKIVMFQHRINILKKLRVPKENNCIV